MSHSSGTGSETRLLLSAKLSVSKVRAAGSEFPFELRATRLNMYSFEGLRPLKVKASTEAGPGVG